VFLLTRGLLCLAVVGLLCGGRPERAWWLGVNLFGWSYMSLAFPGSALHSRHLPTESLLKALGRMIGFSTDTFDTPFLQGHELWFLQVGHCLWGLLAAVLGGLLAHALFGNAASRPENATAEPQPAATVSRRSWLRPGITVMAGCVLVTSVAVSGSRMASGLWAGATYLLTWGLICLAGSGALLGRGKRREFWLGAALFGASFMILNFAPARRNSQPWEQRPTVPFVSALRPWFTIFVRGGPADSYAVAAVNARILEALERPVTLRCPDGTTLADVLKFIEDATRDRDGQGIPIYVDQIGLQEAEQTLTSKVSINLERGPVETLLRLCVKQLELMYDVRDGLLVITSGEHPLPADADPVLIVGRCLLALIAVALGGVLAPLVCALRRRPDCCG
jgi:hypothetical protein